MAFLDQIREALAKKQAAQHPDSKTQEKENTSKAPVRVNKPQKKVTGRGR